MKNLQVQELILSFGEREILRDISFTMNEKTRAALCGANGSGKSTLLKALTGEIAADSRRVTLTRGARISYLPQSDIVLPDKSVYATAEEGYCRFSDLLEDIEKLEERVTDGTDQAVAAAERLALLHETLSDSGYYDRKTRIETILLGLGFTMADMSRRAREFSGGYQMRMALARVLVENPDFLLLDEPTNYLDIEAMTWLLDYLRGFRGGLMLVSHDQEFLDSLVTETYEIFNGKLTRYSGNYTKYTILRKAEIEALEKERKRQEEERERTEEFIERFRYKATKAKQVQSRVKMLEKQELVELPSHLRKLKFSFPPSPHSPNDVMKIQHLGKSYGDNTVYSDFSFMVEKGERLAITGRNGAGKSTLLRILAGEDTSYSGSVTPGPGVVKGYFAQDTENTLNPENDLVEEMESVSTTADIPRLRNLLGSFLFSDDDVYKKIKVLSGGERSRLALLKILLHPSNLLLLDEPTNHLDINAKEMLLEALGKYEGTVVFVSHDKHFIKNLATRILYLSDDGPEFFKGDYSYFEYKLEEKEAKWKIRESGEKDKKEESGEASPSLSSYEEQKAKRNRLRSAERDLERISGRIAALEKRISELDEESGRSEVYSDGARITKVLKEKKEKEDEKEKAEEEWLELSLLIEELSC